MALASLKVTTPSQTGGGSQPGAATVQSVKVTVPETTDLVLLTGADGPAGATGPAGPPGISATWRGLWSSGTTYTAGPPPDGVLGSNDHWYISLTSGNVGHDPTADGGVHWADTSAASSQFVSPRSFGGLGDDSGAQLSSVYGTLAAAQAVYSFATALTQTLDYCAIQAAINYAATLGFVGGGRGGRVLIDTGRWVLSNKLLIPGSVWVSGVSAEATWLRPSSTSFPDNALIANANQDNTQEYLMLSDLTAFGSTSWSDTANIAVQPNAGAATTVSAIQVAGVGQTLPFSLNNPPTPFTIVPAGSISGYASNGTLTVGSHRVIYSGKSGGNFTGCFLVDGAGGTIASGAAIAPVTAHNIQGVQVIDLFTGSFIRNLWLNSFSAEDFFSGGINAVEITDITANYAGRDTMRFVGWNSSLSLRNIIPQYWGQAADGGTYGGIHFVGWGQNGSGAAGLQGGIGIRDVYGEQNQPGPMVWFQGIGTVTGENFRLQGGSNYTGQVVCQIDATGWGSSATLQAGSSLFGAGISLRNLAATQVGSGRTVLVDNVRGLNSGTGATAPNTITRYDTEGSNPGDIHVWKANQFYWAGAAVLSVGQIYTRNTSGISAASWGADSSNWTLAMGTTHGATFTVMDAPYNAKGDATVITDGVIAANVVASASTPFASTDVGKAVVVEYSGAPSVGTTISGFTDSGHVTLAASPGNGSGLRVAFGTDDSAAIRAAYSDLVAAGGGTLLFPPGRHFMLADPANLVCIQLARDNAAAQGLTVISGYGATLIMSPDTPCFCGPKRVADYDLFRSLRIEGFEIDAMNIRGQAVSGVNLWKTFSPIFGSGGLSSLTYWQRLNFDAITFKDLHLYNVAVEATSTYAVVGIWMLSYQVANNEATATRITNITLDNVKQDGGTHASQIGGETYIAGSGTNIYYDNVLVRDCRHDPGLFITVPGNSTSWVTGLSAYGGSASYERLYSYGMADAALEIDNVLHGVMRDCVTEDCSGGPFAFVNYQFIALNKGDPPNASNDVTHAQQCVWENCHVVMRNRTVPMVAGSNTGFIAFQVITDVLNLGITGGTFTVRRCSALNTNAGANRMPTYCGGVDGRCEAFNVDGFLLWDEGFTINQDNFFVFGWLVANSFDDGTGARRVSIKRCHIHRQGSVTSAVATICVMTECDLGRGGGTYDDVDIDATFSYDLSGAGLAQTGATMIQLSGEGHTSVPSVRQARLRAVIADWTSPIVGGLGIWLGDGTFLDITGRVYLSGQYEAFGTYPPSSEYYVGESDGSNDGVNDPKVFAVDTGWGGGTPAASNITVTASPFTYRNLDYVDEDILIEGGTVSNVAVSRNGSTFYTAGAATNMRVARLQNGDYVKITYSSVPTVTKIPAA